METILAALLDKNLALGWLFGAIAVISLVIRMTKGLLDFHYDYFTRRHLRRMHDLLPLIEVDTPHHAFLKQVIAAEVFKISSGIETDRQKAEALMQLCEQGLIPPRRLKHVDQYLVLSASGKLQVQLDLGDKIEIGYSAIVTFGMLAYGVFAFFYLSWASRPSGWLPGLALFLMCSLSAFAFSGAFRRSRTLRRLEAKMIGAPSSSNFSYESANQETSPAATELEAAAAMPTTVFAKVHRP